MSGNYEDDLVQLETLRRNKPPEQMRPVKRVRRRGKNPDAQRSIHGRELPTFHRMPNLRQRLDSSFTDKPFDSVKNAQRAVFQVEEIDRVRRPAQHIPHGMNLPSHVVCNSCDHIPCLRPKSTHLKYTPIYEPFAERDEISVSRYCGRGATDKQRDCFINAPLHSFAAEWIVQSEEAVPFDATPLQRHFHRRKQIIRFFRDS